MRYLIVPTCLLICAWAEPVNAPIFEFTANASGNVTVVAKSMETTGAALRDEPAETSEQALTRGELAIEATFDRAIAATIDATVEPFENNFPVAVLDIPVPSERRIPIPPRRAIPKDQVCEALADAALDNNVPTPFLIKLIWQESGFNQNAVSPVGAQGVAQFMPATAAERGLRDPFNPLQAVRASAEFLRDLIKQFGNTGLAAAAYNAGPKRVQDWLAKRSKLPEETRNYVQRITGVTPEHWKANGHAPAVRIAKGVPCQREAGLLAANGPANIPLPPASPNAAVAGKPTVAHAEAKKPAHPKVQIAAAVAKKPAEKPADKKSSSNTGKTASATVKQLAAKQRSKPAKSKKIEVADAHK